MTKTSAPKSKIRTRRIPAIWLSRLPGWEGSLETTEAEARVRMEATEGKRGEEGKTCNVERGNPEIAAQQIRIRSSLQQLLECEKKAIIREEESRPSEEIVEGRESLVIQGIEEER